MDQSIAVELMPYVFSVLGVMALHILKGIDSSIKEIKVALDIVEKDLREGLNGVERRVDIVETRCKLAHHE